MLIILRGRRQFEHVPNRVNTEYWTRQKMNSLCTYKWSVCIFHGMCWQYFSAKNEHINRMNTPELARLFIQCVSIEEVDAIFDFRLDDVNPASVWIRRVLPNLRQDDSVRIMNVFKNTSVDEMHAFNGKSGDMRELVKDLTIVVFEHGAPSHFGYPFPVRGFLPISINRTKIINFQLNLGLIILQHEKRSFSIFIEFNIWYFLFEQN